MTAEKIGEMIQQLRTLSLELSYVGGVEPSAPRWEQYESYVKTAELSAKIERLSYELMIGCNSAAEALRVENLDLGEGDLGGGE